MKAKVGTCKVLKSGRLVSCSLHASAPEGGGGESGLLELKLSDESIFKSFHLGGSSPLEVTSEDENICLCSNDGDVIWLIMNSSEDSTAWASFLHSANGAGGVGGVAGGKGKDDRNSRNNANNSVFQPAPPLETASSKTFNSPRSKPAVVASRLRSMSEQYADVNNHLISRQKSPSFTTVRSSITATDSSVRSPVVVFHNNESMQISNSSSKAYRTKTKIKELSNENVLNISNRNYNETDDLIHHLGYKKVLNSAPFNTKNNVKETDKSLKQVEDASAILEAKQKANMKRDDLAKSAKERKEVLALKKEEVGGSLLADKQEELDDLIQSRKENVKKYKNIKEKQEEEKLNEAIEANRLKKFQDNLLIQYNAGKAVLDKVQFSAKKFDEIYKESDRRDQDQAKYLRKLKTNKLDSLPPNSMESELKKVAELLAKSLKDHRVVQDKRKEDEEKSKNRKKQLKLNLKKFTLDRSQRIIAKRWRKFRDGYSRWRMGVIIKIQSYMRRYIYRSRYLKMKFGYNPIQRSKRGKTYKYIVENFVMRWASKFRGRKLLEEQLYRRICERALVKRAAIIKTLFAANVSRRGGIQKSTAASERRTAEKTSMIERKSIAERKFALKPLNNNTPVARTTIKENEELALPNIDSNGLDEADKKKKKGRYHRSKRRSSSSGEDESVNSSAASNNASEEDRERRNSRKSRRSKAKSHDEADGESSNENKNESNVERAKSESKKEDMRRGNSSRDLAVESSASSPLQKDRTLRSLTEASINGVESKKSSSEVSKSIEFTKYKNQSDDPALKSNNSPITIGSLGIGRINEGKDSNREDSNSSDESEDDT